jgi:uncharacterized protein (DUF934 family)
MALIKERDIVTDDPWRFVADGDPIPAGDPAVITLDRWKEEGETLRGRNKPLGIKLSTSEPPAEIAGDLDRFDLIALEFSTISDGRAFSYARLLRDRYRFKGELRAIGFVLRDHLDFMSRCGIDSFELMDGKDPENALKAFTEFSVAYQPSTRGPEPAYKLRNRPPAKIPASGG